MTKRHSQQTKDKIKASIKATREKRSKQHISVYELKINARRLSRTQKERLERVFLEAKWLKNTIIAQDDIFSFDASTKTAQVKMPDGSFEGRELATLGSSMKQTILAGIKNDIKGLKALKTNGRKIGRLKFVSQVKSIDLRAHGYRGTYNIDRKRGKVRIQKIGWVNVYGLDNIPEDVEFANAKLINKPDGVYLKVTTYSNSHPERKYEPGSVIGVDMGLKTAITTSEGDELNLYVEETERLKRLKQKLGRQVKGSNNYGKTLHLIQREYQKMDNRRDDLANKVVSDFSRYEVVFFQDENLSAWKKRDGYVRGGNKVQKGILGRVKSRLQRKDWAVMIDKSAPTTQFCRDCGVKNKHHPDERMYFCPNCGYEENRDIHATLNMVYFGVTDNRYNTPVDGGVAPVEPVSPTEHFNFLKGTVSVARKQEKNPGDLTQKPRNA